MIKLFNTLTRKKELFKPLKKEVVSMYHCGPTVYDYAHIGNIRPYIFADILRRTFEYNDFEVKQIINITDVGHLTSDEDEGADKVELAAEREKKGVREIAQKYTDQFIKDLGQLNINTEQTTFPKASEHISEQIALIKELEDKDYTYITSDGVYFDTSKFEGYEKLGKLNVEQLREGARVVKNPEKKNPSDFALWRFSPKTEKRHQEWDSPWGRGFPGWHIECSAMSMLYLGETFDIHTGGIDHIPVHHTNEIAQSEGATGKPFVNYWMHNEFITVDGKKMAKSLGNIITVEDIARKGVIPLAYRYWLLQAHYRTRVNFTWEALEAAQNALHKLYEQYFALQSGGEISETYQKKFTEYINDDLDTPQALALTWQLLKDDTVPPEDKRATLVSFDKVLGFNLDVYKPAEIPKQVLALSEKRESARKEEDWEKADKLRKDIEELGYTIEDTNKGPKIKPLNS
ncbi:cysteine--tRNA ligase [bacterium]|nr:cysteine--tRNA ligase [bacterium]|tara:strand:+ start:1128 stop:2507 length:1380 start_codon:yes stop_codon:yes gene_type:complete